MPADTIAHIWKTEAARVIGGLARLVRDVSLAEDFAQEALLAALEQWPRTGVPDNPGAWLMTTAKHRALNALKRSALATTTSEALAHTTPSSAELVSSLEAHMDGDVRDDVLRLIFTACHPVLSSEARVALTLRMVAGLSTPEVARAFLTAEPTVQQRIVRAKRTLADAHVPFELPGADDLGHRLRSVLEVIYLVFNEGYSATSGDDLIRPALCDEALRLARLLTSHAPAEPEAHALLALLALQASRTAARTDAQGDPILLDHQDRTRWNAAQLAEGLASLARADALTTSPGPYHLQAAIAACHARAPTPERTDWDRIATLYAQLLALVPSPVVALNHAVAVSRAQGPAAGLKLLDTLSQEASLAGYHLLPSARADLLERLGRTAEARAEFLRAASLTSNSRQRERLEARARRLTSP